ncbi:AI-2E family transporter [Petroclostridium sp. X23]|uniref:AI-2E family transporter n=1 Tax=Petroclostridium sp. X23 TaxID=3045146 RepID=UPI0024AD5947|nr:AI-2E family transporter [Petroclostridium sp. X23]WHH59677.1 AI-2E family transporter [Petroclostridium sp. X23]
MKSVLQKKYLLYAVVIIAAVLLVFFIYTIRKPLMELLSPVFFALLITYLLNPLVNLLEDRKIPRGIGIAFVYLFVAVVMGAVLVFIIPQLVRSIKDLTQTIPIYFERYNILFYEFVIRYQHSDLPIRIKEILDQNIYHMQESLVETLQTVVELITGAFSFLFDFILGVVIAFYMTKDIVRFKKVLQSLVPRKVRAWVLFLVKDIDVVLSGFIRGQLLVAAMLSMITAVGLWILGIKYSLILGIIAGLLDIIPYFGPILGVVPAVIIAFIDHPVSVIWVVLLYVIIQQIEGAVLSPRIVGSRVGLHPVVIIIAVLAGGKFFGFIGLLLAVPVTGIIKVIGSRIIKSIV